MRDEFGIPLIGVFNGPSGTIFDLSDSRPSCLVYVIHSLLHPHLHHLEHHLSIEIFTIVYR